MHTSEIAAEDQHLVGLETRDKIGSVEKFWGCYKMNIADFPNSSQLTYRLAIGSNLLLFAFSKASNTAIFSAEDSLTGKYATLVNHKMEVLGHNFSFSLMNISMHVRPKGVRTYVLRFMDVRHEGACTYV